MSWTWRLEGEDGEPIDTVRSPEHASQSDAENWLGESWRELADAGIASVTLFDEGTVVYGPMPLSAG